MRPNRRATTHASLLKASNILKPGVAQNALVRAYRRFEKEAMINPNKVDKQDKVSIADARKVRWIMVLLPYRAMCGTLKDISGLPGERHGVSDSIPLQTQIVLTRACSLNLYAGNDFMLEKANSTASPGNA
ncbi:hypothetical protein B0T10DRAFT_597104 [Thelonectria olida]|uniref:Uncharacterized protein n=1 Tax=Thelonectria olida TaxID=1576542 RepID=A0A9P9AGE9_9HYPO|nr:hypothetical protein B0T10DRAFT_597104 [Thelonectria olida]